MENIGLSKRATLTVFGFASVAFLGLVVALTQLTRSSSPEQHVWIGATVIVLSVVYMAGIVLVGLRRWQARDEMARAGQKWAFHWGAVYGLSLGALAVLAIVVWSFGSGGIVNAMFDAIHLPPVLNAAFGIGVAIGAMAIVLPLILGQLVLLGVWWWKHR